MNIFGVIIIKSRNLFAETFVNHNPPGPFIILSEVDSTNNYAMAKLHAGMIQAGSCFMALEQTAGKGQRGRNWLVKKGENITMSACLKPIHSEFPFLLSAAVALGCYDFIKETGVENVSVKWPNDVYIGDRKAAGILIENVFRGTSWEWAVAGMGINMNQVDFGDLSHKATSVKKLTGTTYDIIAMGKLLNRFIHTRLEWMKTVKADEIMQAYNSVLYRKNETVRVKKDSAVFSTEIKYVSVNGELITNDTMERIFNVGEIEFL